MDLNTIATVLRRRRTDLAAQRGVTISEGPSGPGRRDQPPKVARPAQNAIRDATSARLTTTASTANGIYSPRAADADATRP
ncbi:hypothetical protein SAMN05216360_13513 [Methylobacterium phyllostachyos]|uniref:Uncharacterized protein n=1 Tax=Methylobacterium phyllostachyos TaxID=582672 RepID=A0A1H0LGM7_9HYPH|nr:hypothetical protein [Methylobacterium phyllostachyos]SDO67171.1 hypothetical protein SAMN05216360_13513 [Methylobacterium phyllostachyos]